MTAEIGTTTVAAEEAVVLEIVEETRPENIPLPTDSMITVRLSDAQLQAEPAMIHAAMQESNEHSRGQNSRTSLATSSGSTPSSRSSSRTSQASTTSNSVDWEGLEKTEQQELKDDATDEVRARPLPSTVR